MDVVEEFMIECMADVQSAPIPWLWPERIPRGMLTIIGGIPDQGKSFLTLDIAARISTGTPWPDGTTAPCGNVLLLSAEDVGKYTIRPRLDGMGADPQRVFRLSLIRRSGHRGRLFDMTRDLVLLEQEITRHSAILVVIDPVTPYLGKTDSFKDAEVRAALAPLAEIAERMNVAILLIMHLTKESNRPIVHRFSGSGGFTAAPRAAFVVVKDPSDKERRLFMPAKANLVKTLPTLAFRLEQFRVVWEPGVLSIDPDEVLQWSDERRTERSILDDAKHFLQVELAQGPVFGKALKAKFAKLGSERTLNRAKATLGVASLHDGTTGEWWWAFPGTSPTGHFSMASLHTNSGGSGDKGKAANGNLDGGLASLNVYTGEGQGCKVASLPECSRDQGGLADLVVNWDDVKEDEP